MFSLTCARCALRYASLGPFLRILVLPRTWDFLGFRGTYMGQLRTIDLSWGRDCAARYGASMRTHGKALRPRSSSLLAQICPLRATSWLKMFKRVALTYMLKMWTMLQPWSTSFRGNIGVPGMRLWDSLLRLMCIARETSTATLPGMEGTRLYSNLHEDRDILHLQTFSLKTCMLQGGGIW